MERLAEVLLIDYPECQWSEILADANWNHILQFLFLMKSATNTSPEYRLDRSTRQIVEVFAKGRSSELMQDCIKAIPLPNSKVLFSSYSASGGVLMGKPAVTHDCTTIGEVLKLVGDKKCTLVEGWPVPRRFGQNSSQFSSNKGLRVVLEYNIISGYSQNTGEKNLTQ